MKKLLILTWVVLVALALQWPVSANPGKKPFSGKITYQVKVTGNIPPEMAGMMPTQAVYQIDDQFVKVVMTPSMMGAGAIIMNHEQQTMRMLLDVPGNKFQLIMDEELKEQAARVKNIAYTTETRTIAGYKCTKAMVDMGDGQQMEIWYTNQIQVKNLDKMWGSLKGFPLEFTNSSPDQGISMKYTATEVKPGKIDKKQFEIGTEYQPITEEQLMQLMGGME